MVKGVGTGPRTGLLAKYHHLRATGRGFEGWYGFTTTKGRRRRIRGQQSGGRVSALISGLLGETANPRLTERFAPSTVTSSPSPKEKTHLPAQKDRFVFPESWESDHKIRRGWEQKHRMATHKPCCYPPTLEWTSHVWKEWRIDFGWFLYTHVWKEWRIDFGWFVKVAFTYRGWSKDVMGTNIGLHRAGPGVSPPRPSAWASLGHRAEKKIFVIVWHLI